MMVVKASDLIGRHLGCPGLAEVFAGRLKLSAVLNMVGKVCGLIFTYLFLVSIFPIKTIGGDRVSMDLAAWLIGLSS
jgi:hypothetical protein